MPVITNLTRNTVLADRAELATRFLERIVGLLSRTALDTGEALIFPRCNAIHTCFMRFPIDVLFLKSAQGSRLKALGLARGSRLEARGQSSCLQPRASSLEPAQGVIVKVVEHLKPFRFAWAREADAVVELPVGTIARTSTQPLDNLAGR